MDRPDGFRAALQRRLVPHRVTGTGRRAGGLIALSGWWIAAFVVQWVLLAVLTIVVLALARQIGVLHLRLSPVGALEVDDEGPALGSAPERRTALTRDGRTTEVGGPGPRRLVAFVSATCPICEQILPSISAAASAHRLVPQVIQDPELELSYDVPGVPFVVVLDEAGVARAKGTVNSLEQLDGLIDTAERRMRPPLEVVG